MNKDEAQSILRQRIQTYRKLYYEELRSRLEQIDTEEVIGSSGARYQLEFQLFWDDRPKGDIRLVASIDDGGVRAFFPVTDGFIKSPDGKFVGE